MVNIPKKGNVKEKKSPIVTYQRFQLAANQLDTAIMLFLMNIDKLSAITLAGAADVIFCELVNRDGNKNFTDLLHEKENGQREREAIGTEINNLLNINALKHFDKDDPEYIELGVEDCAIAAILKALANYNMLKGNKNELILAFCSWVRANSDPKKYHLDADPA